jgi:methylglutaconyl-CoA hydratase
MAKAIAYSQVENLADAEDFALMLERIDTLPVPVIGRVHGAALGGGVGLAAVCDIVVAAEDTIFGLTEVKLGILPAVISPYVLRKVGVSAARELFLSGARFGAGRARDLGLVHEVVPEAELDSAIERRITDLLTSGPKAVAAAKALIRDVAGESPKDVIGLTTSRIAAQRVSPEGQEGMRAFLQKRKPDWAR